MLEMSLRERGRERERGEERLEITMKLLGTSS